LDTYCTRKSTSHYVAGTCIVVFVLAQVPVIM
jgi:hypothetical protein